MGCLPQWGCEGKIPPETWVSHCPTPSPKARGYSGNPVLFPWTSLSSPRLAILSQADTWSATLAGSLPAAEPWRRSGGRSLKGNYVGHFLSATSAFLNCILQTLVPSSCKLSACKGKKCFHDGKGLGSNEFRLNRFPCRRTPQSHCCICTTSWLSREGLETKDFPSSSSSSWGVLWSPVRKGFSCGISRWVQILVAPWRPELAASPLPATQMQQHPDGGLSIQPDRPSNLQGAPGLLPSPPAARQEAPCMLSRPVPQ